MQNVFISETERDRAISMKFFTHRVSAVSIKDFSQKSFSSTFASHLEFLRKMQKRVYLTNGARWSDFDEIFDPQGICTVYWRLFPKIIFPPLLAGILNFCVKCKNIFISETVPDRAILIKFLTRRVYTESAATFAKNCFPTIFAFFMTNFCVKMQKLIILETMRQ